MAKIYTKTGDDGTTGLFGGPRVTKSDARIEAYGTVDELNSVLGCVLAVMAPGDVTDVMAELLTAIQSDLFSIGAELASPDAAAAGTVWDGQDRIAALEREIDRHEGTLPPLKTFILPGGTPVAAQLHFARTVCRRAERRVVSLAESLSPRPTLILTYLNRLSDLLFVLSRTANFRAGRSETPWSPPA